jgi:hypothetical protein
MWRREEGDDGPINRFAIDAKLGQRRTPRLERRASSH